MAIGNFTGAGSIGKHWALGDFDGDGDNDTVDITTIIGNFSGAGGGAAGALRGAPAAQHNPDLIYDMTTGEVQIHADGTTILSFSLLSDDQFASLADFSDIDTDVIAGIESPVDNGTDQIGWVSTLATGGVGFDGPELAALGAILPHALSQDDLTTLLKTHIWSGPNGTGGSFDLVTIPEPNGLVLAMLGVLVAAIGRRRL